MTLEDEVRRSLERANRWERVRQRFLALCAVVVTLAGLAIAAYREWLIWSR